MKISKSKMREENFYFCLLVLSHMIEKLKLTKMMEFPRDSLANIYFDRVMLNYYGEKDFTFKDRNIQIKKS